MRLGQPGMHGHDGSLDGEAEHEGEKYQASRHTRSRQWLLLDQHSHVKGVWLD